MTNDDKPIALPRLPDFQLTPEQVQAALKRPIRRRLRRELVIPVEGIDRETDDYKPNAWNRIVRYGMAEFKDATGIPVATLIRQLLILYFTGNLYRADSAPIMSSYGFTPEMDDTPDSEPELLDDDLFSFPGGEQ
jgi:hypothetical protein